jgi:hypothetical protein
MNRKDLKKLILEELNIFQEQKNSNIDAIVDYLLDFEDEDMEELDEVQGRTAGGERKYKLKGNQTVEDVTRFLKLVQTKMKNKTGRGRKPNVFTDEDVKGFAELLTKKDGFSRKDILSTISFYENKPFQAAQKMMDVLGDRKMTSDVDEKGNTIEIGKGYIEVMDKPAKEKISKKKEYEIEDDLDTEEGEEDFTGSLEDLESEEYLNEVKMLQKRAGLLKG